MNNKAEGKQRKKVEIKQYKNFINQYLKWNWWIFSAFIFDIIVFLAILFFFISSETWFTKAKGYDQNITDKIKYFILIASFYVLLKFTLTNFFYSSSYYKNIVLFDKEIKIKDVEFHFTKKVDYVSLNFLTLFIVINIVVAFILNYEADAIFSQQKLIKAAIATLSSLLLIPSFVSSLSKIFSIKQSANLTYKSLIRDQFLATADLLQNYEVINDYEALKLQKLSFTSKKGFFLLTDYADKATKAKVLAYNESIIAEYQKIWTTYCQFLALIHNANLSRSLKYTSYHIQRIFDTIMLDFLDI